MVLEKYRWAMPNNAKTFHVFAEDNRSLCAKWGFFGPGESVEPIESVDELGPKDCKTCGKALLRLSAAQ